MQFREILPVLFDSSAHGSAKCRTTMRGSKAKKQGGAKAQKWETGMSLIPVYPMLDFINPQCKIKQRSKPKPQRQ